MKQFLVYLAGPITGLSHAESVEWRDYATKRFPPHIIGVSPMRGKPYLAGKKSIANSSTEVLSSPRGITTRDRNDVMRADLVLVNLLGATKISIGTIMEFGWADAWRKPLVVAMEEGNPHWHAMVREVSGFIVPTLDEAIAVTIAVLSPTVE